MNTRVYYNLHKRTLSIQQKQINPSGNLVWKVVRYSDYIHLKDAKFKVSESGRQRVIKEKKKNVHAYVVGTEGDGSNGDTKVFYNPYKHATFVDENQNPVHSASEVLIVGNKAGYSIIIKYTNGQNNINK